MRIPDRTGLTPQAIAQQAKRLGLNNVVLSFSGGKDSLAAWIVMRDAGINVVPCYKAQFPDLEFEQGMIRYYEKFFGTKIHQVLHAGFYNMMSQSVFADPIMLRYQELLNFRERPDNDAIMQKWKKKHGYELLPTVIGLKKGDSAQRFMRIARAGVITKDKRFIYPMANASDKMCFQILKAAGCPLPSFYQENGESFDTLRITTLDWIQKHAPKDWERIQFWLPFIKLEYVRLNRPIPN